LRKVSSIDRRREARTGKRRNARHHFTRIRSQDWAKAQYPNGTGKEPIGTAQQRRKGETDFTERMKYGNQFMVTTLDMRGAMEAGKREMVETCIFVLLGAKERLSHRRSGALIRMRMTDWID